MDFLCFDISFHDVHANIFNRKPLPIDFSAVLDIIKS